MGEPLAGKGFPARFLLLFLLTGLFLLLFFLDPMRHGIHVCAFNRLTGLSCPTCGLTRSMHAFLHLEPRLSFQYHFMGPFLILGMSLFWIKWAGEILWRRSIRVHVDRNWIWSVLIALGLGWFVYWLVRIFSELSV